MNRYAAVADRGSNHRQPSDTTTDLPHAVQGLTAHLMYEGVTTPYRLGEQAHNHPE